MSIFILAKHDCCLQVLRVLRSDIRDEQVRVVPADELAVGGGTETYRTLCSWIESLLGRNDQAECEWTGVVDVARPTWLSAIGDAGWEPLIAMLILAFPEVRWVFGSVSGQGQLDKGERERWDKIEHAHSIKTLNERQPRDPLFDPTGLRDWIRYRTNRNLAELKDDLVLPRRLLLAAAIDEEATYAYLHALAAYRFGCRVDVLTTWRGMQARLGPARHEAAKGATAEHHDYWLLLEDMSLNFADRDRDVHLLDLEQRAACCEKLDSTSDSERSDYRVLVTTGQSRAGGSVLASNREYLRRKLHGQGKVVLKPLSGMFDLWEKIGLLRTNPGTTRAGNVGDFEWPPAIPTETFWPGGQGGGHGTPGKLTLVAETLIRRAKHLLASVESGPDAVRGAVLSTDALESTGCRTPTTATEALALKHSFEVLAECQFSGVEYHISIRPRLNEVRAETAVISRWFAKEQSANAMLNAEMYVLQRVVRILRQHAQFDEEQLCMNRVRSLHNTLWMRQSASRLVLFPLLRYLELLLSSFAVFVGVLVVWVTGLALLFGWSNAYPAPYETYTGIYAGVADAVSSFFSNGPTITHKLTPKDTSNLPWRHVGVACLAMVSGFLHLGVFMAHMYTIASRK